MSHFIDQNARVNVGVWRKVGDHAAPVFTHLCRPEGPFPDGNCVHALWYFLLAAHRELDRIEKNISYEIDGITDQSELMRRQQEQRIRDVFKQMAHTSADLYAVTLDEMFGSQLFRMMRTHCMSVGMAIHPKVTAWVTGGGRAIDRPEQGTHWFQEGGENE